MIKRLKNKMGKDANLKELLLGSATSLILKITGMFIGYVVMMYIAKKFGAESIGIYNIILSTLTLVSLLSACGINISVLRYAGEFNKKAEIAKLKQLHYFSIQIVGPISIVLSLVLYFSADYIAQHFFENLAYVKGLQLAAIALPFFSLATVSVEYIRGLKIIKVSEYFRTVNRPLINLFIIIGGGTLGILNKLLPVYGLITATIITCITIEIFIWIKTKNIPSIIQSTFTRKDLLSTSLPMMITSIASYILGNISLFILEIDRTTEEVGIFSIALKLSLLASIALTVINTISAPKFSELFWSNDLHQLQKLVNQSSKMIFIASICLSFFLALFSHTILGFFGEQFIAAQTTLYILILSQLINAATGSVGVFMNMTGHAKTLRNIVVISSIAVVALSFIIIPTYGVIGAAITILLGSIFVNVFAAIYIKHQLGFTTYYLPITPIKTLILKFRG